MSGDTPDITNDKNSDPVLIDKDAPIRIALPATLILERRIISRSFWSLPSWYLHTVAIGEHLAAGEALSKEGIAVGKSDKGDLFAWSGFDVTLYKDACERYWHALIGDKPLVYVICRDKTDDMESGNTAVHEMQPTIVTVDYDDASASAETDSPVLSAPIPSQLYRYMERFVLTHYQPREFKKRTRRNWSKDVGKPENSVLPRGDRENTENQNEG